MTESKQVPMMHNITGDYIIRRKTLVLEVRWGVEIMSDCYTCKYFERYEWEDGYLDEWCSLLEEDDIDFFGGNCKYWMKQEWGG